MILEMTGGQHELLLVLKDIKTLHCAACRHVSVKRRRVLILHIFFHIKKKSIYICGRPTINWKPLCYCNHQQQSSGKVTDVLFQFAGTASLVEE